MFCSSIHREIIERQRKYVFITYFYDSLRVRDFEILNKKKKKNGTKMDHILMNPYIFNTGANRKINHLLEKSG
jgi:hypothetical protein